MLHDLSRILTPHAEPGELLPAGYVQEAYKDHQKLFSQALKDTTPEYFQLKLPLGLLTGMQTARFLATLAVFMAFWVT